MAKALYCLDAPKSSVAFVSGDGAIVALFFLLAGGALQAPAHGSWL